MRIARALVAAVGFAAALALFVRPASAQSARLALQSVFGQPATAFAVSFGTIDSDCVSTPSAGVACVRAPGDTSTTWHGSVVFAVRLTGIGNHRARLVAVRQAGGTVPPGALLDGPAGSPPARAYPTLPSNGIALASSLGNGNTVVTRAIGMRVTPNDASGAWTTGLVYSLVME
jgi:hypothetical protein